MVSLLQTLAGHRFLSWRAAGRRIVGDSELKGRPMVGGNPGSEHVERGLALEQRGDVTAAEAAYALADQAGSAEGALFLGGLLKRRGDLAGADAAFRRGD